MIAAALAAVALAQPPTVRVWDDQLANDATPAQVRFVATHEAGSQKLTRPQIAQYKGSGSIDQADNFFCAEKSTNVPASR